MHRGTVVRARSNTHAQREDSAAVNESNLPPQFDPAKFPVPGGITVPLKSFGEGEYRLEIKITDKTSNKVLTQNVRFNVKA